GRGVPKDYENALAWYNLAAARGNGDAKATLEKLTGRKPSEQLAKKQPKILDSPPRQITDGYPRQKSTRVDTQLVRDVQQHLAALGYKPGPNERHLRCSDYSSEAG
ncbi:unnamed protein product, partial [marine sediment metagenome]